MAKTRTNDERPVMVWTEAKMLFFGYATATSGDTIKLSRARNCISWPASQHGFMGLAKNGPEKACRVGPPADIELRKIVCVVEVTPEAVKKWEESPWGN